MDITNVRIQFYWIKSFLSRITPFSGRNPSVLLALVGRGQSLPFAPMYLRDVDFYSQFIYHLLENNILILFLIGSHGVEARYSRDFVESALSDFCLKIFRVFLINSPKIHAFLITDISFVAFVVFFY